MNKRSIKCLITLVILLIIISLNNNCLAVIENNVKLYEISKSKEEEFLKNIYETETEELKIKQLNKEISDNNYINKEIFKTKILSNNSTEYIYKEFGKTQKFEDGEYQGILDFVDFKIETINNGYYEKIDEKLLKFNNYTDNDLNNIEKEILLNNKTYYLINVKWETETTKNIDGEEVPITYKGEKIYQTIQKITNPNTYKVTVRYSGRLEKIDTIYNYKIIYENKFVEKSEINKNTIIIISGIGLTILLSMLLNKKNTYVYSKVEKGFKLIKMEKLSNRNMIIDITKCKNKSIQNVYAIKVKANVLNKLKGRTISIVLGNRKKDIVLWNDYYEIKL